MAHWFDGTLAKSFCLSVSPRVHSLSAPMPDTDTTIVDKLLVDDDDNSDPFLVSALANAKVSTPCCIFCCSPNHEVSHCLRLLNLNKGLEFIADHPDVVTSVKKNQASFLTCLAPLYGNFISSATKLTLCKKPHVRPLKALTSKSAFKASTLSVLDNTDKEVPCESCNPDDGHQKNCTKEQICKIN
jgi:hypothetical protein